MDVNIYLFDGFETLDAFGPVEIFGRIPDKFTLKYFSLQGGAVTSAQHTIVITKPIAEAVKGGVLLIPGGRGTRREVGNVVFLASLKEVAINAEFCLAVCTGSALLAKTGVMDGYKATSNKKAFEWVRDVNRKVEWIYKARWVEDGKFYTSSGVSAGIDMALDFIAKQIGRDKAYEIADHIEYIWNADKNNDVFAVVKA